MEAVLQRIRELEAEVEGLDDMRIAQVNRIKELLVEIKQLKSAKNADKKHYMGIAKEAQATNAELQGALEPFAKASPKGKTDPRPIWDIFPGSNPWRHVSLKHFKQARTALTKAKAGGAK